jgi:hypothetical protein
MHYHLQRANAAELKAILVLKMRIAVLEQGLCVIWILKNA